MKLVNFRNKKIFYRVEGNGEPVMLLHGFAENGNLWNYQVEKLKNNFQLIVPNLPGNVLSEMIKGKVSMSDYADAIKAIVDVEIKNGAKTFALIGHSMGGYITLAFAEKYSELLNGIGLFHSTSYADDDQKKDMRNKGIDFIKKNGTKVFLKNTFPNLFSEKTKKENPGLIDKLIDLSKNFTPDALIQYYEAMRDRADRSSVLKSFAKPVLFIHGFDDNAVPLKSALEQSHLAAVSHFKILKKSGHMGMWEEEQNSTSCIENFLTQL